MEFLIPFLVPPAAFAALMAALYYIYPSPLVHGYNKFGGYFIAGLTRKYITANNLTYCYYEKEAVLSSEQHTDENGDPKTFLFLHGYTGSKIMWMTMVRYLPKEWRLILVDLPGHGESSFDGSTYDAYGFTDKIHEFITAMDLQNLNLIGCSLGSLIASNYASVHSKSQRLKSITLMCPPFTHKFPQGVKTEFIQCLEKGHNKVMPTNADEFQEMLDMVLYDSSKFTFPVRFRQALIEAQLPMYPNFLRVQHDLEHSNKMVSAESIQLMAKKVTIPTLVLWGNDDKVCHPSGANVIPKLVEHAQVVMLERCGHAMTMDRPRKCAQLVHDFILQNTA